MADVTIKYKGSTITEMSETETKNLQTAGMYCEGDISVNYTKPKQGALNCKTYEVTLSKASKWVLLATLDDEVLAHINDASLVVSFVSINNPYEYVSYSLNMAVCSNTQIGVHNNYPVYGVSGRTVNATSINQQWSYYPANKTDTDRSIGGFAFRVSDGKYYIYPVDGYVREGTYLLTFAWKE